MKKAMSIAAVLLAAVLAMPGVSTAAGISGATVQVLGQDGLPAQPAVATDADGAFTFEGLAEGSWVLDVVTADQAGKSQITFAVPVEAAPARLAGRVTALEGAELSLQVNADIGAAGTEVVTPEAGFPALPPAWNLNWARAQGKLQVFLAGAGVETLETVTLTSAAGSIESTAVSFDPLTGVARASFPKRAAFLALVPADALRGDTVAITVEMTTAVGSSNVETAIRLVGPKKSPLGKHGPKLRHGRKR